MHVSICMWRTNDSLAYHSSWSPEVSLLVHGEPVFLGYFVSLGTVSHWPHLMD